MFRFTYEPSSGSYNQCLAKITSHVQLCVSIQTLSVTLTTECKNPLEKFSPRFFGIKKASSSLIIFQRAKLSTRSIAHLCWCY